MQGQAIFNILFVFFILLIIRILFDIYDEMRSINKKLDSMKNDNKVKVLLEDDRIYEYK